jgi:hypothetical protein
LIAQVLQRDTSSNGASSSSAIQHNVLRPGTLSNMDSGITDVAYWDLLSHPDIDDSISRAKSASDAAVLRRKGHLKEQDNLIEFMRRMHETHTCEEVMIKMERWVSVSTVAGSSSNTCSFEVWRAVCACGAQAYMQTAASRANLALLTAAAAAQDSCTNSIACSSEQWVKQTCLDSMPLISKPAWSGFFQITTSSRSLDHPDSHLSACPPLRNNSPTLPHSFPPLPCPPLPPAPPPTHRPRTHRSTAQTLAAAS